MCLSVSRIFNQLFIALPLYKTQVRWQINQINHKTLTLGKWTEHSFQALPAWSGPFLQCVFLHICSCHPSLLSASDPRVFSLASCSCFNGTKVQGLFLVQLGLNSKVSSLERVFPQCPHLNHSLTALGSSCSLPPFTKLCLTLWDPMNYSTPGFPVLCYLSEITQIHVHWVNDVIQPSHPLSAPSVPALNLSHHQGLFQWVGSSHQVTRVLELQLQYQSSQWIFSVDFLWDWLVWSSCSPRDSEESSAAPEFENTNSSVLSLLYSLTLIWEAG